MRAEFHAIDAEARLQELGFRPGWYTGDQRIHLLLKVRSIRDHANGILEILDQGVWTEKMAQTLAETPDEVWQAMCAAIRHPDNDYAVLDIMGWD